MNSADVRFYLYVFMRRLPLFLLVAGSVTGIGVYIAKVLPPVYRATSTILVESPQIPTELARSTGSGDTLARFQKLQQELQTRESLVALANRHGIYPREPAPSPSAIADDMRSRIVLEPVYFGGNQEALGFSVSFEAEDRVLAAEVANDLTATILARDVASRSSRANDTLKFFEGDVNKLVQEVADVEKRLQDYKTRNLDALPDSLEFRRDQQIKMQSRLRELEREEATLTSRRVNYLQYYSATGRVSDDAPQSPEFKLLQELQAALATQRSTFQEDSPAITSLRARIAAVESHLRAEPTMPTAAPKPVALDMQLAEIDERLQAIASERQSIKKSYATLTASIEATPANEAELNALERGYANVQNLYSAAMARLAEASIGEQIEARFKGERLALIEDAQPPDKPIGPKRFMIAAGGAAAGIVAALVVVAGLEFLNAKVRRPIELQRALGIDPLATIPFIPSARITGAMALRWRPMASSLRDNPNDA